MSTDRTVAELAALAAQAQAEFLADRNARIAALGISIKRLMELYPDDPCTAVSLMLLEIDVSMPRRQVVELDVSAAVLNAAHRVNRLRFRRPGEDLDDIDFHDV